MHFVIEGSPATKKNSQQIVRGKGGRPVLVQSARYKAYEKLAVTQLCAQMEGMEEYLPIENPVEVVCKFYMQTRRLVDLTNLLECADDVMVRAGVLADDNSRIIVSHDGSRVMYDKEHPRTEIDIIELAL